MQSKEYDNRSEIPYACGKSEENKHKYESVDGEAY